MAGILREPGSAPVNLVFEVCTDASLVAPAVGGYERAGCGAGVRALASLQPSQSHRRTDHFGKLLDELADGDRHRHSWCST
jgi:hypothetical protein